MELSSLFSHGAAFVGGTFAGAMLERFAGHLWDKIIGRVRLEIRPDPNANQQFHGFYIAAEKPSHVEQLNLFVISVELHNESSKPFTMTEYEVDVRFPGDNKLVSLHKHEAEKHDLKPDNSWTIPLHFKNFTRISELRNKPLEGESVKAILIAAKLPLIDYRIDNGIEQVECRITLHERRRSIVRAVIMLKQIHLEKDDTGTHFRYLSKK